MNSSSAPKLDLLAIAAHPDDAELGCGGTLAGATACGQKAGVIDLTQGELGTRGSAALRLQEAEAAKDILGLSFRANAELQDGFFQPADRQAVLKIISYIRLLRPERVLANAITDRHPDHARGARLVAEAAFLAGLRKIETTWEGEPQAPWRPKGLFHIIQAHYIEPQIVVDISDHWETKKRAVMAYGSQFHNPNSEEPGTFISDSGFMKLVEGRAIEFGKRIGVTYGEGYTVAHSLGVSSLDQLIHIY